MKYLRKHLTKHWIKKTMKKSNKIPKETFQLRNKNLIILLAKHLNSEKEWENKIKHPTKI